MHTLQFIIGILPSSHHLKLLEIFLSFPVSDIPITTKTYFAFCARRDSAPKKEKSFFITADPYIGAWMLITGNNRQVFDLLRLGGYYIYCVQSANVKMSNHFGPLSNSSSKKLCGKGRLGHQRISFVATSRIPCCRKNGGPATSLRN